ncbi:carbohydrate ABC transporter substrate-binding protein, CUT1 family (TC 3.A.1.1.-) [Paenibacillus sp. yr247]|uniref:ABC transporter substrate-binding protein n=1 Tax=Paenibacillus sp. yr247 TaxID=1761880 RepID=UPI00088EF84D|nr:ABC transporter substrate-binding protein [Paenibacillus sp. yr247]SDO89703.1 carbohydrate ABC transporter substrate-binding protein, CUT1 family (TC 3.A.1.1.-) [Paenibacillus sp. yr247]
MKRNICGLIAVIMVFSLLTACASKKGNTPSTVNGVTTIEFWAATNPTQQAFWQKTAKAYEQTNPKVKINVSVIKESPSSEATIQAAIAGGSAPTISENINRGFGAQLAASKALVPLDTLTGFNDIVTARMMSSTIKPWQFADGHQYVLPIYSNAMLFGWRLDILKELGYTTPPQTYSEIMAVNAKLKAKYPDKFFWAKADLADPTAWKRWFDFFMIYDAASNGNKFIEGNKFVGDDNAGVATLKFIDDLRKNKGILAQNVADPFETGTSLFIDLGPWTFTNWAEKFPNMKYNENYTLSMPPVPDGADPKTSKTFADTKGLVIYASATKEQQAAALDFVKWVYSDPKNDAQWFDQTKLPPARDDLTTNDSFKAILDKNAQLKPYAENVPNAVPPMDNPKFNDLQTIIGQEAWNKVVRGEIDPATGWANMKKAIEGALK